MTKALTKIDRLKLALSEDSVQKQFQNAMGKHADSFTASLIDVYGSDNYLQKCDPAAVIQESLKAAVLKLPISKGLGFAYIIPYGGNPQFQMGYKGMIQLAMRSGQMRILNADAVYEGELANVNRLTGLFELTGEKKSNSIVGYFVYMELINGFQKAEYWTKEAVYDHGEKFSKSFKSKSSPWKTDFDAMAKKTVLRSVLSKYAPMSVEFIAALNFEAENEQAKSKPKDITDKAEEIKLNGAPPPKPKPPKTDKPSSPVSKTEKPDSSSNQEKVASLEQPELCEAAAHLKELRDDQAYEGVIKEAIADKKFTMQELNYAIDMNSEKTCQDIVGDINFYVG